MALLVYEIVPIEGLKKSKRRRIAFLRQNQTADLNALTEFIALSDPLTKLVRSRFDLWIDCGTCDTYFHGWPNDQRYKGCFVFKWNQKNLDHRMYGFIRHPLVKTNPRFQLCVLCSHATKNKWETDPSELKRAKTLSKDARVLAALALAYPDVETKGKQ